MRTGRTPRHACGQFLFESGPPWTELREHFRCECGTWFRPGELELLAFLFRPRSIHPHAAARGHYWYRVKR